MSPLVCYLLEAHIFLSDLMFESPLCYQLTRNTNHWKLDILRKLVACGLSNMRSDKKIWASNKEQTKRRHLYGPQEFLQPHQYVSQFGDYKPIRYTSWLSVHQKTLQIWTIFCTRYLSPYLLLEFTEPQLPRTLTGIGLDKLFKILHVTSFQKGCHYTCS